MSPTFKNYLNHPTINLPTNIQSNVILIYRHFHYSNQVCINKMQKLKKDNAKMQTLKKDRVETKLKKDNAKIF